MRLRTILGALAVVAVGVPSASAVNVVGDANAKTTYLTDKTVITVTQNGTLTVTEPGEIELLVVGGGGGGGGRWAGYDSGLYGGAGGAGGVVYRQTFAVTAGAYDVTIGTGGVVNDWSSSNPVYGGQTTVFGLTAYGGGQGAMANARNGNAGGGASGGGGAKATGWDGTTTAVGGKANKGSYDNLGHDGADAPGSCYAAGGGGGGAGSAADGTKGGEGFKCGISGVETYYAGGGYSTAATAEFGGGNMCYGGGGHWGQTGGNGVVIVSFVRTAGTDSEDFRLAGGNRKYLGLDGTALAFTENGSLTVTGDGFVDVLLVGGGGGGGESVADGSGNPCSGGGGGAGGFVYCRNLHLSAGTYPVTVGLGGVMNTNAKTESMGGNSTILGLTAWGGGFGAKGQGFTYPSSGGSGGGGSIGWNEASRRPGAAAGHTGAPDCNLANAGGDYSGPYTPGGGGGAGAVGTAGTGGAGLPCNITGEEVHYAGGGGYHIGGVGGGGKSGVPGTDGLGGGGGSGAKGGKGIVIVRFRKADYETCFDDATGGKITHCRDAERKRYTVHTFTQNGTFSLPHAGLVELLLVGGGGAGGAACPNIDYSYGGGGGAGGVIHKTSYILEAGDHPIVIGAGGIVTQGTDATANGGNTMAFDLTAWGGGFGAKGGGFTTAGTGASGGGGTIGWDASSKKPGRDPNPACVGNLGNRGGDPGGVYTSGGGGGAGGAGDSAGNGGIGYACGITGAEIYYAGGGNGNKGATTSAQGSGNTCFGGGGDCGKNGGAGVVIVRYQSPDTGMLILIK